MIDVASILVANALAAAVLAAVVFAVTRVWRNPHVGHVLWLLVLLKLIVPPAVELPVFRSEVGLPERPASPSLHQQPARSIVPPTAESPPAEQQETGRSPRPHAAADPPRSAAQTGTAESVPPPDNSEVGDDDAGDQSSWGLVDWLLACWLTGSVLVGVAVGRRAVRFGRAVRNMLPASRRFQAAADELPGRLKLRTRPAVKLATADLAPLVWCGFGRPMIVLPAELTSRLSEHEVRTILAHELAHLARRDHWVRWLEVVVTILYWWHPAVWLARREIRRCEDICCDAYVLRLLPGSERTYAEAMLRTASLVSRVPRVMPMLASSFGRSGAIKRRIEMVLKHRHPRPLNSCVRALLAAIAVGLLAVSIGLAEGEDPPKREPPIAQGDSTSLPEHAVRRYGSAGIMGRLLDDGTATTADGRLAATIEPDGTLALWDVNADRRLASYEGNESFAHSGGRIAFSPDASKLMFQFRKGLYVWDIGTSRLLFETREDLRNPITAAAFSPDGKRIAVCRENRVLPVKEVHIWDAITAEEILTVPFPDEMGEFIQELSFSPDGRFLAVATWSQDASGRNVAVWDFEAGKQTILIEGAHADDVTAMLFSTDGQRLYTGGRRSAPYLTAPGQKRWGRDLSEMAAWDVATGNRILEFKPPQEWEGHPGIGLSADGSELYTLHDDRFAIWDAATGALKRVLARDRLGPPIGPVDEVITIHGRSGPKRYTIDSRDQFLKSHSSLPINTAILSEDGERVVTAGVTAGREHVQVWDAARGTVIHELNAALAVRAIAEVPSEGLILALTDFTDRQRVEIRSQVRAWERYTGGLQYAVRLEGRGPNLAVSPNGKLLAVLSQVSSPRNDDPFAVEPVAGQKTVCRIEVLDVITGSRVASLPGPTLRNPAGQEVGLRFSPDSRSIASLAGSEFQLRDIKSGELRKSFNLEGHSRPIPPGRPRAGAPTPTQFCGFAIAPNLRWAATSGLGHARVFIWNLAQGTKYTELTIDGMTSSKLAISPDSRLLAVSAVVVENPYDNERDEQDGNVIAVWDVRHGRQLLPLTPDPSATPNSISFSPDGKYLLSASGAKSAILWDLSEARAKLE